MQTRPLVKPGRHWPDAQPMAGLITSSIDNTMADKEPKKKYPDRFFVHGLIDFTRPGNLKKEFEDVVRQGFKGLFEDGDKLL